MSISTVPKQCTRHQFVNPSLAKGSDFIKALHWNASCAPVAFSSTFSLAHYRQIRIHFAVVQERTHISFSHRWGRWSTGKMAMWNQEVRIPRVVQLKLLDENPVFISLVRYVSGNSSSNNWSWQVVFRYDDEI